MRVRIAGMWFGLRWWVVASWQRSASFVFGWSGVVVGRRVPYRSREVGSGSEWRDLVNFGKSEVWELEARAASTSRLGLGGRTGYILGDGAVGTSGGCGDGVRGMCCCALLSARSVALRALFGDGW